MDRKLFYPGQIPLSAQFLQSERSHMVALAYLSQGVFGTPTLVDGLACTPMTPTSLTVQVSPGHIYSLASIDATLYGSLAADITHNIVKQGIILDVSTFTLVPPATAGQSIKWLIQAALHETDADNIVLPYVNSNNPSLPFSGPNNSGTSQPTTRKCAVALSAKAGVAATTGTETVPAADPGYVGLYAVTVPYGATTLDTTNIAVLSSAPFLFKKLPELPGWVQSGEYLWGDDTGTANAIVANLAPIPAVYKKGMHAFVKKVGSANTGNVTANFNGLGAVAVLDAAGAQIGVGNMTSGMVLHLVYNGTAFIWINGSVTNTSISSINATSGQGISVGGSSPYPVSLNFPALATDTPTALDLLPFYDNEGSAHKVVSYASFLALLQASFSSGGLLNMQFITASGTYTKTPGAKKAIVFATGGGAGGAGNVVDNTAAGGGAGATAIAFVDLTSISTVACVVGAGGARGTGGGGTGGDGGDTSFGTHAVAGGGKGGRGADGFNSRGGLGGVATTGLAKLGGDAGDCAGYRNGGTGGSSFWGGAGVGGCNTLTPPTYPAGGDATGYGSGGGGGDGTPAVGGLGMAGCILVLEFA